MITSDGRFLHSPRSILEAVRHVTEDNPGVYRIETWNRSDIAWAVPKEPGAISVLVVPADRHLELWCYTTIATSKDASKRALAAEALSCFPSQRAITTLKQLLKDPGLGEDPNGKPVYVVRRSAWETLQNWDDKIAPPQLRGG